LHYWSCAVRDMSLHAWAWDIPFLSSFVIALFKLNIFRLFLPGNSLITSRCPQPITR